MERNTEIRETIKKHRFYMYEVAEAAGISEPTLVRWMRLPLTDDHYKILAAAIEKLKGAAAND